MSNLQIRRIPFDFEGVDFIWNPDHPAFSMMMNNISFQVIGLEKYFCRAMRDAEAHIKDPAILEETRQFNAQEAIHSRAHLKHCKALIARYPGLQEAMDKCVKSYDDLYDAHGLKFHLAYAGGLESMFTPLFRMIINYRDILFAGGDPRVSSLFLWHFCEEIEHRSSAISIYNHVYGDHLYRLLQIKRFYKHGVDCAKMLSIEFKKHVPEIADLDLKADPMAGIPKSEKKRLSWSLLACQMPWYDHDNQKLPPYYAEWVSRFEGGENMALAYGGPNLQAA
jgi:hypothetical protein